MKKLVLSFLIITVSVLALGLTPDQILQLNQRMAADYFWNEANPSNGLIRDRSTPDSPSSIAAVGFGLTSLCIAAEHGWIPKIEVYNRILTTLRTFQNMENEHGFYYHFVDMWSGKRAGRSEVSSIDTALFISGALFAGQYFKGTEVEKLANDLYRRIDWKWMTNGRPLLSMGWDPQKGFLPYYWDSYSEHMIMYLLAIGSPTHPISAESWYKWYRIEKGEGELKHISCSSESLFTYLYSHAFVDFRYIEDKFGNYWENSKRAIKYIIDFASKQNYKTFKEGFWGVSAGDGPTGYKNYGARFLGTDGTVVPYAMVASVPLLPDESKKAVSKLWNLKNLVWGRYGFVSGFNLDQDWYSYEFVGIDKGIEVLMTENYYTRFVWKTFMKIPYIQKAIDLIGFERLPVPEEEQEEEETIVELPYAVLENFDDGAAKFGAGAWHGGASTVEDATAEIIETDRGYVWKLYYNVAPEGKFNGAWLKLGGFDASEYAKLTFLIKGDPEIGHTTTFKLELKSPTGAGSYVITNVPDKWTRVVIPFEAFEGYKNIDFSNLTEIAIVFEDWRADVKSGVIYMDDFEVMRSYAAKIAEDFNEGIAKFGMGAWHGGASSIKDATAEIVETDRGNAWKIYYNVSPDGKYNGTWLKLGFFDASRYEKLAFYIKGDPEKGHTSVFKIELKSPSGMGYYVLENVPDKWTYVEIPLSDFTGYENIDFSKLTEFTTVFEDWRADVKEGIIYIDDIQFVAGKKMETIEGFDDGTAKFGAGAWHGGASTVEDATAEIIETDRGYVWKLYYNVAPEGKYNGAWLELGNFDATEYNKLVFDLKGDPEKGHTSVFKIELKSSSGMGSYVIENVPDEWTTIEIPFESFQGYENIDFSSLTEFTVVFEDWRANVKSGVIYIDNISVSQ